ncbi:MAG: hypothetical protein AB7P04_07170 [Bacteriovoracia bacterium]
MKNQKNRAYRRRFSFFFAIGILATYHVFDGVPGLADEIFVERATGAGVPSSDLDATTELVRVAVASSGSHRAVSEAGESQYRLRPRLLRLGGAYVMTLEKIRDGKVAYSAQMKAARIEDLDQVGSRLTRAVINEVAPAADARVGDVTETEVTAGQNRRSARKGYYFGLGPAYLKSSANSGLAYYLSGAYAWDLNDWMISIGLNWASLSRASLVDFGIGGRYFFSDRGTTPYVSADFGMGIAEVSTVGFVLGGGGGLQLLRTTALNIDLGFRAGILFKDLNGVTPYVLGARLGVFFN